jgi:hypothetical protein
MRVARPHQRRDVTPTRPALRRVLLGSRSPHIRGRVAGHRPPALPRNTHQATEPMPTPIASASGIHAISRRVLVPTVAAAVLALLIVLTATTLHGLGSTASSAPLGLTTNSSPAPDSAPPTPPPPLLSRPSAAAVPANIPTPEQTLPPPSDSTIATSATPTTTPALPTRYRQDLPVPVSTAPPLPPQPPLTTQITTPPAPTSGPTSTPPAPTYVTQGAVCATAGATGVTKAGVAEICAPSGKKGLRWEAA